MDRRELITKGSAVLGAVGLSGLVLPDSVKAHANHWHTPGNFKSVGKTGFYSDIIGSTRARVPAHADKARVQLKWINARHKSAPISVTVAYRFQYSSGWGEEQRWNGTLDQSNLNGWVTRFWFNLEAIKQVEIQMWGLRKSVTPAGTLRGRIQWRDNA